MRIIVHIGLHKSGSTYLKTKVFPRVFEGENYVRGRKLIESGCLDQQRINIGSSEGWSGSIREPHNSWQCFTRFLQAVEPYRGEDLGVILVLRRHAEWLQSAYLQQIKMGNFRDHDINDYAALFGDMGMNWTARVSALEGFRCLVLNYQELVDDPVTFARRIGEFAGVRRIIDYRSIIERESGRANLTPRTEAELKASQLVSRYNGLNRSLKDRIGMRLPKMGRDVAIRWASTFFPGSPLIEKPAIRPDLESQFESDWRTAADHISR